MKKKTSPCLEAVERGRHQLVKENKKGTLAKRPLKVRDFDRQRGAGWRGFRRT